MFPVAEGMAFLLGRSLGVTAKLFHLPAAALKFSSSFISGNELGSYLLGNTQGAMSFFCSEHCSSLLHGFVRHQSISTSSAMGAGIRCPA
jgi:hypothetical protein